MEDTRLEYLTLRNIQKQAAECALCELHTGRNKAVFGRGNENTNVVICGMCPGPEENRVGLPFVGTAGKILDAILNQVFNNPDFYITNLVKCFVKPGISLKEEWMSACLPYLLVQLHIIKPKVIVLLGGDVAQYLLDTDTKIGQLRNMNNLSFMKIPTICTYHPSYLARGGGIKHRHYQRVVDDFMKVKRIIL